MKIPSPLRQRRRWLLLIPALLAVAALAWWLSAEPPPGSPGQAPPATSRPPPPSAAPSAPETAKAAAEAPDIFAQRNWEPPEAPVAAAPAAAEAPPPAPPPEAPPLPFRYLGKVEEPGLATVVFLVRDNEVLAVRPGDDIDRTYRVVRIKKDEVFFLYRPLKIEQALPMGAAT